MLMLFVIIENQKWFKKYKKMDNKTHVYLLNYLLGSY